MCSSDLYWTASELPAELARQGFRSTLYWGFPETASALRRLAVAAGMVPRTMAARAMVKTVFSGYTAPIPAQLNLLDADAPAFESSPAETSRYRLLYVEATRQ